MANPNHAKAKNKNIWSHIKIILSISLVVICGFYYLQLFQDDDDMSLKTENVISYLSALQAIALNHGGSRSIATGHQASVEFVLNTLGKYSKVYDIAEQELTVQVQVDEAPPSLSFTTTDIYTYTSYEPRLQLATLYGSGSALIENGRVFVISQCGITKSPMKKKRGEWVALVDASRPLQQCSYCDRLVTAIRLGASGAIVINSPGNQEGYPHPLPPRPGRCHRNEKYVNDMRKIGIVALSDDAAFDFLTKFAADPKLRVDLRVVSAFRDYPTRNIIATTKAGDPNDIVMFGSHLDGVPAGPGINDDGSGAMATLELARAFGDSPLALQTIPRIRFAWWTAEEIGLLGSKFYVKNLTDQELKAFRLNIDTDMIASPNWVRGVWDGSDIKDETLRSKTRVITDLITAWFRNRSLPTFAFKFNGRSDFQPFLDAGVPCGGVITGEDEIKSIESEKMFGGVAHMVLDPCYHQDCDRVENLQGSGLVIMKENLALLTYLLKTFSQSKSPW